MTTPLGYNGVGVTVSRCGFRGVTVSGCGSMGVTGGFSEICTGILVTFSLYIPHVIIIFYGVIYLFSIIIINYNASYMKYLL